MTILGSPSYAWSLVSRVTSFQNSGSFSPQSRGRSALPFHNAGIPQGGGCPLLELSLGTPDIPSFRGFSGHAGLADDVRSCVGQTLLGGGRLLGSDTPCGIVLDEPSPVAPSDPGASSVVPLSHSRFWSAPQQY